jgi:hypothetical protein
MRVNCLRGIHACFPPGRIETLRSLLLAREVQLSEREGDFANLRDTVTTLQKTHFDRAFEIEHLKLWIARLQHMQFGRKSEEIDRQIEQLELRLEDLQADADAATVDAPKRPHSEGGKATGLKPLPEHLSHDDARCRNAVARSTRTFPSNSTTYRGIGECPSPAAQESPPSLRLHYVGGCAQSRQLIVACPAAGCSHVSWSPDSVCPCIDSQ